MANPRYVVTRLPEDNATATAAAAADDDDDDDDDDDPELLFNSFAVPVQARFAQYDREFLVTFEPLLRWWRSVQPMDVQATLVFRSSFFQYLYHRSEWLIRIANSLRNAPTTHSQDQAVVFKFFLESLKIQFKELKPLVKQLLQRKDATNQDEQLERIFEKCQELLEETVAKLPAMLSQLRDAAIPMLPGCMYDDLNWQDMFNSSLREEDRMYIFHRLRGLENKDDATVLGSLDLATVEALDEIMGDDLVEIPAGYRFDTSKVQILDRSSKAEEKIEVYRSSVSARKLDLAESMLARYDERKRQMDAQRTNLFHIFEKAIDAAQQPLLTPVKGEDDVRGAISRLVQAEGHGIDEPIKMQEADISRLERELERTRIIQARRARREQVRAESEETKSSGQSMNVMEKAMADPDSEVGKSFLKSLIDMDQGQETRPLRATPHLMVRSLWGHEELSDPSKWDGLFARLKSAGFDAVEAPVTLAYRQARLWRNLLQKHSLKFIAQLHTCGYINRSSSSLNDQGYVGSSMVDAHVVSLRDQLQMAKACGAYMANSHSGHDSWELETATKFIEEALIAEREIGLQGGVAHETHRRRILWNPFQAAKLMRKFPSLKITADLSHWVVVCERVFDDLSDPGSWKDILDLVAQHCVLVHARVGYNQGPQVADPRAPEYQYELQKHEEWWKHIWRAQCRRGLKYALIEPEFGPSSYMHTTPFTCEPVADLWDVNLWMAHREAKLFVNTCPGAGSEVRIELPSKVPSDGTDIKVSEQAPRMNYRSLATVVVAIASLVMGARWFRANVNQQKS